MKAAILELERAIKRRELHEKIHRSHGETSAAEFNAQCATELRQAIAVLRAYELEMLQEPTPKTSK